MGSLMTVVNFVMLLGFGAAREAAQSRGITCSYFDPEKFVETNFATYEPCLERPEIAAVANALQGTREEKTKEVFIQCLLLISATEVDGALNAEKVKSEIRLATKGTSSEDAFNDALNSCDGSLMESYKAFEFMKCVFEHCKEY